MLSYCSRLTNLSISIKSTRKLNLKIKTPWKLYFSKKSVDMINLSNSSKRILLISKKVLMDLCLSVRILKKWCTPSFRIKYLRNGSLLITLSNHCPCGWLISIKELINWKIGCIKASQTYSGFPASRSPQVLQPLFNNKHLENRMFPSINSSGSFRLKSMIQA